MFRARHALSCAALAPIFVFFLVGARLANGWGWGAGRSGGIKWKDGVTVLSPDNFDKVVLKGEHAWIVMNYADWCGHCRRYAPSFQKTAKDLTSNIRLRFGAVSCVQHVKFCSSIGVRGYPTLRGYHFPGSDASYTKNGMDVPRTGDLAAWARKQRFAGQAVTYGSANTSVSPNQSQATTGISLASNASNGSISSNQSVHAAVLAAVTSDAAAVTGLSDAVARTTLDSNRTLYVWHVLAVLSAAPAGCFVWKVIGRLRSRGKVK